MTGRGGEGGGERREEGKGGMRKKWARERREQEEEAGAGSRRGEQGGAGRGQGRAGQRGQRREGGKGLLGTGSSDGGRSFEILSELEDEAEVFLLEVDLEVGVVVAGHHKLALGTMHTGTHYFQGTKFGISIHGVE